MGSKEYDNFDKLARQILAVPHDKVKAALEEEKRAKEEKRKSKTSAVKEPRDTPQK